MQDILILLSKPYWKKQDIIALGYDQKMPEDVTKDVLRKMKIKAVRIKGFGAY